MSSANVFLLALTGTSMSVLATETKRTTKASPSALEKRERERCRSLCEELESAYTNKSSMCSSLCDGLTMKHLYV